MQLAGYGKFYTKPFLQCAHLLQAVSMFGEEALQNGTPQLQPEVQLCRTLSPLAV